MWFGSYTELGKRLALLLEPLMEGTNMLVGHHNAGVLCILGLGVNDAVDSITAVQLLLFRLRFH